MPNSNELRTLRLRSGGKPRRREADSRKTDAQSTIPIGRPEQIETVGVVQQPAAKRGDQAKSAVLKISDLRKTFGDLDALRGVNLELGRGEQLALLGPNGAGKTTLIRCLSGRAKPTSGKIQLFGRSIQSRNARRWLGIVPQEIALYGDLTTRENLLAFGRLNGLGRKSLRDRVDWAMHWTGLSDRADDLVGGFSGGMQRRVNLACGVMHAPKVLLLDEPTVGVDPQSRERIFAMLDELNRDGTSILLTTHHLDEAQSRSDRIVIVDQGKVIANGDINTLVDATVGKSRLVRLRLKSPITKTVDLWGPGHDRIGVVGSDLLETRIDNVSIELTALLSRMRKLGHDVTDIEVQPPSLHHVFLHLTGRELRD